MFSSEAAFQTAHLNSRTTTASPGKGSLLSSMEALLCPTVLVVVLWILAYVVDGQVKPQYLLLSCLIFALTFPGFSHLQSATPALLVDVILSWLWISALLLATGFATGYIDNFSAKVLSLWFWVAPLALLGGCLALRGAVPFLVTLQGPLKRAIIVGMNEQGVALANDIKGDKYSRVDLLGFVDSRSVSRLLNTGQHKLIDKLDQLARIVRDNNVQLIYLSLPMASQPRILQVLDELKDTTASIYFVPDMFVTDLIQGRAANVSGTPVISVCETPFMNGNGFSKRCSDIAFASVILTLIFPVMIAIAIAIKRGSPGPVIFKQRRYGLDGDEIVVYKFRSMTVTEDGHAIQQAQKNDSRVTPLGAFLRRTSLDELPQFINVIQGRMSIVGPRPHAVAHNEMYRKLIKGYMVRHKVKPGITGLAQVNGFRGETDVLEKMEKRIKFDLDYLRNWSLRLDIHIILKTIRLVLRDQKAY
jgi:putative colanic acid biosynthesis UDP-glucose lipid carrier transferase